MVIIYGQPDKLTLRYQINYSANFRSYKRVLLLYIAIVNYPMQ